MIREPANDNFEILPDRKKVNTGGKKKAKVLQDKESVHDEGLK
jgi:hypothetical protein